MRVATKSTAIIGANCTVDFADSIASRAEAIQPLAPSGLPTKDMKSSTVM